MRNCSVVFCNSTSENEDQGLSFFSLPGLEEHRNEWMRFLYLANSGTKWVPTKYTYLCSKHFRPCCLTPKLMGSSTHVIKGHYPSVLDGEILINPKSKCLPEAPEKSCASIQNQAQLNKVRMEQQRAYLVNKLTTFSAPRIILGEPPLTFPSPVPLPTEDNSILLNTETSVRTSSEISTANRKRSARLNSASAFVRARGKKDAFSSAAAVKVETDNIFYARKRKYSSSSPSDSLRKENKMLRKSVSKLEKQMGQLSKEVTELKERANAGEERYGRLLLEIRNVLEQNAGRCGKDCKCKVEVVDISD